MKYSHGAALGAALLLALPCTQVLAISDGIRKDRTNECAIYMCLPTGFGEGCGQVFSAYWGRITDLDFLGRRKYTDLPAFHRCLDGNNVPIMDLPDSAVSLLEQGQAVSELPGGLEGYAHE